MIKIKKQTNEELKVNIKNFRESSNFMIVAFFITSFMAMVLLEYSPEVSVLLGILAIASINLAMHNNSCSNSNKSILELRDELDSLRDELDDMEENIITKFSQKTQKRKVGRPKKN